MEEKKKRIIMGLDVSTACIGVSIIVDDGTDYGTLMELTHINPKVSSKIVGIEMLFLKNKIFRDFIIKYKNLEIDKVIIEEPLLRSNNANTVSTLLRFNGMVSQTVYEELGVIPEYISSYEAREYSFPEFMAIRKYGKDEQKYPYKKIIKEIRDARLVLFGSYPWTIDKKTVIQDKVSEVFPDIEWLYNKKGELKKENFDAVDAYVAALGYMNKEKHGELDFKVENIQEIQSEVNIEPSAVEYDVLYWDKRDHRKTYI